MGFLLAVQGQAESVRAEKRRFDEASRLVDRERELDAIQWQLAAGTDVGARLRAARDTARDRDEQAVLDRALACLTSPNCGRDVSALLHEVREQHTRALQVEMESAERGRTRGQSLVGLGAIVGLCGAILGAWPRRPRDPATGAGTSASGAGDAAATDDERDHHLRARLEELYALRLRALESDRFSAYGEIAAGLSHGLKTPLASIRAATELALAKLGFEHPVAPHLEDALAEVDGLIEQVRRFLLASGDGAPRSTHLVLADLVNLLEGAYAAEAGARGIQWRSVIDDFAVVNADPSLLEMALRNLVENALAAAPAGTTVTVAARPAPAPARAGLDHAPPPPGRWVELAIADEGPGMPEVLVAGGRRASEKPGGSGLGLAIARRIVARHGGALEVRPGSPGGTSVHLLLPVCERSDSERSAT